MNIKIKYCLILCIMCFSAACTQAQKLKLAKSLNPLSNNIIEVGKDEIFYYDADVHTSVGIEVEYGIGDTEVVQFDHSEIIYENKEDMEEGMTGADAATKTLVFKAKKSGETTITISELFRGEIKQTYIFKITVK